MAQIVLITGASSGIGYATAEGRIDVLFNNAGYGSYGPIETVSLEEAQMQIDVNVIGVARMTQLVLPHMRKQNTGRILITSSVGIEHFRFGLRQRTVMLWLLASRFSGPERMSFSP